MTMTFAVPTAAMFGNLAAPAGDLAWLAPLAFAATVAIVALVAKGVAGDRRIRVDGPETTRIELRQAA